MTVATELIGQMDKIVPFGVTGCVSRIVGMTIAVAGLPVPLGSVCRIRTGRGGSVPAEVVGFSDEATLLLPHADVDGVRRGDAVELVQSNPTVRCGERLLGRVLDAQGRCIDGGPPVTLRECRPLQPPPVRPMEREPIDRPLETGVRVLDGMLTIGHGQRIGLFAGSGVGKSTLLGQIARSSSADVNVVVLVGERGREVREFIENDLGPEGLARSVVVAATGDEPAVLRLKAASYGTAIAEYFRDQGRDVVLMMDSVTRFALAQREIGLAAGEPPATRGFPPSVFAKLPRLLERSGRTSRGSITGIYTILVDGDDTSEPISDTVRGVLDGHVMLSRRLAERAHWPAIDVPASISRLMPMLASADHLSAADHIRRVLAAHRDAEDLISIGAYQNGADPLVDQAVRCEALLRDFLCQSISESTPAEETRRYLATLRQRLELVGRVASAEPNNPETEREAT
ncbi:FliI/YscN family ATPase [Stratiformator vulcanicus]|uniref:Putative ATP synthase YscN n=1 Tax=Stratiformator vulcanicus TaxID=2527980 RepID=A0A517R591_9PLAN|nr:FliI/YscN family ATPase [Stratiformator vulcanicus]QDT39058.1 putative ATP synthase YscN [Stratiformator vulcanicus]